MSYIEAYLCMHCERLCLLTGSRACRCGRYRRPAHIICGRCAAELPEAELGDLLQTVQTA